MDFKTLYFLSIVDKLAEGFGVAFGFCVGAMAVLLVIYVIMRVAAASEVQQSGYREREQIEAAAKPLEELDRKYFAKWALRFFIASLAFRLLEGLIPGRRDIVEAYAMIEGSKIITAQNGEAVAKEVGLKFDRFLGIIAKGWGGEPESTPEPTPAAAPATTEPAPAK